MPPPCRTPPGQ